MNEAIQLPAVPTDGELSKEFPSRPNWARLSAMIEGVSGKDLFDDHDFGPASLVEIQTADAIVRDYLKAFDKGGAWWDSPYGKAEKALKEAYKLFSDPRIRETNRAEHFRNCCSDIMRQYVKARTDAEAAAQRKLEQQQREADERAKREQVASLDRLREQAPEDVVPSIDAEIENVKSMVIVPTVVTPAQAAAAVGLPAMPKGLVSNKKPLYERVVVDKKKFITWLAAHPAYIDTIAMSFSFTNLKHSDVQMDGVSMGQKSSITNRGK